MFGGPWRLELHECWEPVSLPLLRDHQVEVLRSWEQGPSRPRLWGRLMKVFPTLALEMTRHPETGVLAWVAI